MCGRLVFLGVLEICSWSSVPHSLSGPSDRCTFFVCFFHIQWVSILIFDILHKQCGALRLVFLFMIQKQNLLFQEVLCSKAADGHDLRAIQSKRTENIFFSLVHYVKVSVILNTPKRKLSVQSDPWVITTDCTNSWWMSTAQTDEDEHCWISCSYLRGNQILGAPLIVGMLMLRAPTCLSQLSLHIL